MVMVSPMAMRSILMETEPMMVMVQIHLILQMIFLTLTVMD